MKISDKFPEIKFFIENPTAYEVLYHQDDRIHNEYPLEVSEAKRIFDYIDYLEYMSKNQKEIIDMFLNMVDKNKMLLNNPNLLDLYLRIKEVSG